MDCIAKPSDASQRGASRTSMPGCAKVSLGGVSRNMAESIARLGGRPRLLSAIGKDEAGEQILAAAALLGIRTEHVARAAGSRTATFTALLDGAGDLVGAVADMEVFDQVQPASVDRAVASGMLAGVALAVCDANFQSATLERIQAAAAAAGLPAWFEPVSVAKAVRGRRTSGQRPWHLTSPNWDELQAMMGVEGHPKMLAPSVPGSLPYDVLKAVDEALSQGLAEHVMLTMGARGMLLASACEAWPAGVRRSVTLDPAELLSGLPGAPPAGSVPSLVVEVESLAAARGRRLWYRLLRPLASVRDTTGAGDALLAGTACAFARGWPLNEAVLLGMLCAHITLFVEGAVAPFLAPELVQRVERCLHGSRL